MSNTWILPLKSYSKECVKKILIEMEDQKQTYEQKAKEALQKMLEDKLQTEQQLQNSQVTYFTPGFVLI